MVFCAILAACCGSRYSKIGKVFKNTSNASIRNVACLLLRMMSRARALVLFSVLKVLALAAYSWLAYQYEQQQAVALWLIYLINALEDGISAMLLVVMLTLVMHYSRKQLAGTDFTFQVALMATVSGGLYSLSGILGDQLGYARYLMMISGIALLCLLPILVWARSLPKDEAVQHK